MYWFSDADNTVLYVGKAKNLRNRVRSYTHTKQLSNRIARMTLTAKKLTFKVLSSELEALLVEAELIRTYQPEFNVLLKDDKSPLYIWITAEDFPQVETIRKKDAVAKHIKGTVLGPYQSAYKVREVLKLVRPVFRWCAHPNTSQNRACFYYHIDQCSGACVGEISQKEYQHQMRQLTDFLRGKKHEIITELKQELTEFSQSLAYEKAARVRDQLKIITEITRPTFKLKPSLLLNQSLTNSIATDGTIYLKALLHQHMAVPKQYPLKRIEGYDVSNTQGTLASVAMVTFMNGSPEKAEYRLFNIKTLDTPNDYHMMKEALLRRQNHPEWGRPQLLVIDGGKGQLRAALSVWQWRTPLISIAKNPDRIIIPQLSFQDKKTDELYPLKNLEYAVIKLPSSHPALKLVQQIRDEAHRFSKKQHSRRRTKSLLLP